MLFARLPKFSKGKLWYMQDGLHFTRAIGAQMPSLPHSFGWRLPMFPPYMGEDLMKDIKGNGKGHKAGFGMTVCTDPEPINPVDPELPEGLWWVPLQGGAP